MPFRNVTENVLTKKNPVTISVRWEAPEEDSNLENVFQIVPQTSRSVRKTVHAFLNAEESWAAVDKVVNGIPLVGRGTENSASKSADMTIANVNAAVRKRRNARRYKGLNLPIKKNTRRCKYVIKSMLPPSMEDYKYKMYDYFQKLNS